MLYADLTGLPPIMVFYGAHEMPVGEAVEFAKRAKDAGVDVTLRSLPEGQHNFILGAGRVPEVDRRSRRLPGGCDPSSALPSWRRPNSTLPA